MAVCIHPPLAAQPRPDPAPKVGVQNGAHRATCYRPLHTPAVQVTPN